MHTFTSARSRVAATALALAAAGSLTACSTAGEGAVSGAGLGALTGLVLGSFSGEAGEGAVIGTAVGAVAGGVIGDQNDRNARYSREQAGAYYDATYDARRDNRRDQDMYRRGADKHSGWGDRYDDRRSSAEWDYYDDRGSYEVRTETVIKRRSSPRVIIRYGDGHTRGYYRSHRPYRSWSWGSGSWNSRYCR